MTPQASDAAPITPTASGPDFRCTARPCQNPHSATPSEMSISGQRIASLRRNVSPIAASAPTMSGVPAQQSAAMIAPAAPAESAMLALPSLFVVSVDALKRSRRSVYSSQRSPFAWVGTVRNRTSKIRSSRRTLVSSATDSQSIRGKTYTRRLASRGVPNGRRPGRSGRSRVP